MRRKRTQNRTERALAHYLVTQARTHFAKVRNVDRGILHSLRDRYLRPYKRLTIDLVVSSSGLDRALELANSVYAAFEITGHRVVIPPSGEGLTMAATPVEPVDNRRPWEVQLWRPDRPTLAYIGSMPYGLSIYEFAERIEMRHVGDRYYPVGSEPAAYKRAPDRFYTWTTHREMPSGRFGVTLYCADQRAQWSRQWQDTDRKQVESFAEEIVRTAERSAKAVSELIAEGEARQQEAHRQWLEDQARRRQEEKAARIRENIKASIGELDEIAAHWVQSKRHDEYFADLEREASRLPESKQMFVLKRIQRARELLKSEQTLDAFLAWDLPEER